MPPTGTHIVAAPATPGGKVAAAVPPTTALQTHPTPGATPSSPAAGIPDLDQLARMIEAKMGVKQSQYEVVDNGHGVVRTVPSTADTWDGDGWRVDRGNVPWTIVNTGAPLGISGRLLGCR